MRISLLVVLAVALCALCDDLLSSSLSSAMNAALFESIHTQRWQEIYDEWFQPQALLDGGITERQVFSQEWDCQASFMQNFPSVAELEEDHRLYQILADEKIRIGCSPTMEPGFFKDGDNYTGFDYDLTTDLVERVSREYLGDRSTIEIEWVEVTEFSELWTNDGDDFDFGVGMVSFDPVIRQQSAAASCTYVGTQ
ncbi:hypothetical protein KIPB_008138, partial [Kipferlia bialata]|eukprot:g8138.t1